jgi:hypothetical protein
MRIGVVAGLAFVTNRFLETKEYAAESTATAYQWPG